MFIFTVLNFNILFSYFSIKFNYLIDKIELSVGDM